MRRKLLCVFLRMDIVFFFSQIHIVLGVLSLIPVGFLLRTSRNNLEIGRERVTELYNSARNMAIFSHSLL